MFCPEAILTFAWKLTVKDAYPNIAKNTDVLTRGNVAEFDRLLHWANGANVADREAALRSCAAVADSPACAPDAQAQPERPDLLPVDGAAPWPACDTLWRGL